MKHSEALSKIEHAIEKIGAQVYMVEEIQDLNIDKLEEMDCHLSAGKYTMVTARIVIPHEI